ncbi:hypothetical protein [Streptomyces sp. NRRL B-3648]|uniref:hypothetical protein n=1 Tax=Streptomyces sp. NRRL B-3648 TaxID=1519493 RepID=UPI00131AAD42|nr:hypothetical protein [Streptomyces sp. NRRL B-3648]
MATDHGHGVAAVDYIAPQSRPLDVWRYHSRLLIPLGLLIGVAMALYVGSIGAVSKGGTPFGVAIGVASGIGYAVLSGVLVNSCSGRAHP